MALVFGLQKCIYIVKSRPSLSQPRGAILTAYLQHLFDFHIVQKYADLISLMEQHLAVEMLHKKSFWSELVHIIL